jgi:hypothetical protein
MSTHATTANLDAPKALSATVIGRIIAVLAVIAGGAAFYLTLSKGDTAVAWSSYLIGAFYALGLGLFGVLWVAILYVSRGTWSVTMRRIPEAMSSWLLPGGVLAMVVAFLGGHQLYHWLDPKAVAADELLQHKAPFLNATYFLGALGVSFVVWFLFGALIMRNSRKQDKTGKASLSRLNVRVSALFIVLYAVTFSLVSFYLLMSLEAHWFSTMYAVLTFTDMVQTGTAFVALMAAVTIMRGQLNGYLNENHLHGIGKMMFAATGFWAYIYFCQFMLIWYANLPEETAHFAARYGNGWMTYLLVLPVLKFVIPFVFMAPRNNKRKPTRVALMAVIILVAQFLELYLLVSPAVGHGGKPSHAHLPLIEFAVTAGFLGLFYLVYSWSLGRHNSVPLKDPSLKACLDYHQ